MAYTNTIFNQVLTFIPRTQFNGFVHMHKSNRYVKKSPPGINRLVPKYHPLLHYTYYSRMFSRIDIDKVLENPRLVRAILGINKKQFISLLATFDQVLLEEQTNKKRKRAVGGGRIGKIKPARNKLFFILWYLKVYPTYDVAAYVFGSSKTKTHVWAQNIFPVLEKTLNRKVVLPKRKIRTPEEFLAAFPEAQEVLIDGMERPTVRSKNNKI